MVKNSLAEVYKGLKGTMLFHNRTFAKKRPDLIRFKYFKTANEYEGAGIEFVCD